jgi:outer membrane biosynthesis protein TonB
MEIELKNMLAKSECVAIEMCRSGAPAIVPVIGVVGAGAAALNVAGVSYAIDGGAEREVVSSSIVSIADTLADCEHAIDVATSLVARFVAGDRPVVPAKREVVVTPQDGLKAIESGSYTPPAEDAPRTSQPAPQAVEGVDPAKPKRRGRPPGSKNRTAETAQPAQQPVEPEGPADEPGVQEEQQAEPEEQSATATVPPPTEPPAADTVPNPANSTEKPHPIVRLREVKVPSDYPQAKRAGKTIAALSQDAAGIAFIKWAAENFVPYLQISGVTIRPDHTAFQRDASEFVKLASL